MSVDPDRHAAKLRAFMAAHVYSAERLSHDAQVGKLELARYG